MGVSVLQSARESRDARAHIPAGPAVGFLPSLSPGWGRSRVGGDFNRPGPGRKGEPHRPNGGGTADSAAPPASIAVTWANTRSGAERKTAYVSDRERLTVGVGLVALAAWLAWSLLKALLEDRRNTHDKR
jgi:hypothetical protein